MIWECPRCNIKHDVVVINDYEGIAGFIVEEGDALILHCLNKRFYDEPTEVLIDAYIWAYLYCHYCGKRADGRRKTVKRFNRLLESAIIWREMFYN